METSESWIIKLEDTYYYGWMNDEYLFSPEKEDALEFEDKEQVYKVLKEVQEFYPKSKLFHIIKTISEEN